MPKIEEIISRESASPLQKKVFDYLEAHPDEVFSYKDKGELADKIKHDGSASSVGFAMYALAQKGLVDKERYRRRIYFGSKAAIAELRKRKKQATKSEGG